MTPHPDAHWHRHGQLFDHLVKLCRDHGITPEMVTTHVCKPPICCGRPVVRTVTDPAEHERLQACGRGCILPNARYGLAFALFSTPLNFGKRGPRALREKYRIHHLGGGDRRHDRWVWRTFLR